MGGQNQNVGFAMAVQEASAGFGGKRRIVVGIQAPIGVRQLDRAVHQIADYHRVAPQGGDIHGDVAVRLAGRVFVRRDDIFGVGEGWRPAAVRQARIPAAMIRMQMGSEDVVDVRRPRDRFAL